MGRLLVGCGEDSDVRTDDSTDFKIFVAAPVETFDDWQIELARLSSCVEILAA
jgi:hypothetical protein